MNGILVSALTKQLYLSPSVISALNITSGNIDNVTLDAPTVTEVGIEDYNLMGSEYSWENLDFEDVATGLSVRYSQVIAVEEEPEDYTLLIIAIATVTLLAIGGVTAYYKKEELMELLGKKEKEEEAKPSEGEALPEVQEEHAHRDEVADRHDGLVEAGDHHAVPVAGVLLVVGMFLSDSASQQIGGRFRAGSLH